MGTAVHRHDSAAVLSDLAATVLERVEGTTDLLVNELRGHDPAYAGDLVTRDELWRSCHDNLCQVIGHLVRPPDRIDVAFEPPRHTGRRRAEQGFPLEHLLHAYRVGGRIIWESLLGEAQRGGHRTTEKLAESASQVWDVIDAYSAVVGQAYRAREAELRRHDEERRLELLDGLLDGKGRDPRLAREAATALNLPDQAAFVVAVLRHALPGPTPPPTSAELRSVWRLRGSHHVGIIALERRDPEQIRDVLARHTDGPLGISPPTALADLAQAYRWAELAAAAASPGEALLLDEHLPAALLAAGSDLATRLVEHVHAPLDVLDADERVRLLETLDVYLALSRNVAETAARLYCHRNTVANRLRRFEDVTGRRLDDLGNLLEIALARLAARSTPPEDHGHGHGRGSAVTPSATQHRPPSGR